MVGWHHQLDGHGFGQTLGDGEGQGGLACCSPCGHKESDTFELLNNNPLTPSFYIVTSHFFDIMKTIILIMKI